MQKRWDPEKHLLCSLIIVVVKTKPAYFFGMLYTLLKNVYTNKLNLYFWYVGTPKIVCDQIFKEIKQKFHHKNVYTMRQMVSVLNYLPKLHVIRAPRKVHYDWDASLDRLYKRPAAGTVNKKTHFQGRYKSNYTLNNGINKGC